MPKYEVTVSERRTWFMTKTFEASSKAEAEHLAEADESWSDLDGWTEAGEEAGESYIDRIRLVK